LRETRVRLDDDEHRKLRRPYIHRPKRSDEILKNPDLQAPNEVTQTLIQNSNVERALAVTGG
jgi:hypothetical protein